MAATVNVPLEPVTEPVELVPSPQLIVAVNWVAVSLVLASVNVAMVPEKVWPSMAVTDTAVTVKPALATSAVLLAVAVTVPGVSVNVTWAVNEPSSA